MNINNSYNQTFTSRNATIRFADNLVRKVNKEFPRISTTKLESFNNTYEFEYLMENLWEKTVLMRNNISRKFVKTEDPVKKLKLLLDTIKIKKLGNCKESAQLSFILAKMNGIDNCKMAYVVSPGDYDYDHAVVLVEDKKPYIIDAWLVFADYIPNAIKKFQKEFRNCFDFEKAKTDKMQIKEDFGLIQHFLNEEVKQVDFEGLKNEYNHLVLENNR